MTTPNAALAYRVLDHIDAHPERHNQSIWIGDAECGTAACFAGWACLLSGDLADIDSEDDYEAEYVFAEGRRKYIPLRAAEALGIEYDPDDDYGHHLFNSNHTRVDLGDLVAEIFGPRPGGDGDPACGYTLPHPAHDFANPDEERDGEFGPTRHCAGVGGERDAPR